MTWVRWAVTGSIKSWELDTDVEQRVLTREDIIQIIKVPH